MPKSVFNVELCEAKHGEQNRRLSDIEADMVQLEHKIDSNLAKVYAKIESETLRFAEIAVNASRRPGLAVTIIISFLSALCVGLLVKTAFGG